VNLTPEQIAKCSPDHPIFVVLERMTKIEESMTRADPELPTHLKVILKHMQEYEELAHLLTPQQIGVLMQGFQKHSGIQLVAEAAAKKGGKKGPKVTVDDLM
jgi:hypothetical protein